jgi:glycosyltransferase involved in cell wall biosynthesis
MKILWLTWKDHLHPDNGGAEVVLLELSKRMVASGHEVTWLTCGYEGAVAEETIEGIKIIRIGTNRYLHSFQALAYYIAHMRNQFDILIEVVNTAPYFGILFERKARRYLLNHQLAREIWFQETSFPLNYFGYYVLEPIALRTLSTARVPVITISESTKADLARFGMSPERTHIISEGIEIEPIPSLSSVKKYSLPTILSLGGVRAMKQTLDQVKAFEIAKKQLPSLQFKIAGSASGPYGKKVLDYIEQSQYKNDITYLGRVSTKDKIKLMQKSHLILQTAIKEGWGLTVTEAASQGTPAVVYDVDGLRDSVKNNKTGIITTKNPEALAYGIFKALSDVKLYDRLREACWKWSQQITFDKSYRDLKKILEIA